MDKVVRAGRILMRRPGVAVPDDIVANVKAALDAAVILLLPLHLERHCQQRCFDAVMSCKALFFIELASFLEDVI